MSYPDKKVEAGKSVETPITTPDGYTFPKGSKFEVKDAPKGVTVDETGKITYNAPKDKTPGDVKGEVLVTLPGHDKPTPVPFKITVTPVEPKASYEDKKVPAGESTEVIPTPADGYKFPTGTTFTIDGKTPDGLTIDPKTGKITYTAPKDSPHKEVTGNVLVNVPGRDKPTPVPFKIIVAPAEPKLAYEDTPINAGETAKVTPNGVDGYKPLDGTTFELPKDAPEGVTINPKTGEISYTAPKDSPHKEVTGNVLVNVPGRDKPTPVPFKITVAPATPKLSYPDGKVETGKSIETPITTPDGYKFPTGTTFTIDGKTPDGLTIDPKTGKITYNVPEGHQPGDVTGKVKVTIPGTDNPIEVPFKIIVTPAEPKLAYEDTPINAGETAKVTPNGVDGYKPLDGTTFELPKDAPEGVTINPKTGEISYTAPKDSPHKEVTGNVLVNVPGRDKPTPVPFKITVAPATPKLSYPDGKVETGKSIETPITTPDGYKFPTGTTFTIDGKTPDGLTIDPKTGKITYNVPEGHQPGDVTGKVKVTIPGTDNPIEVPFKITVTPVPTQPSYPTATGTPGASVDLKLQPGDQPLPQGTTFTKESGPDYVTVTPDGTVTVKVPDSANGGETIQGTVEITYPDGTTKKVPYLVRVEKEEGPAADDSKPQPPTTQDSDHTVPDTGDTTNPDQDKPAPADQDKPAPADQDKPAPADQDKPAPADTGKPATPADQGKQVAGGKGHKVTKTVTKAVQDEGAKKQAPTTLSHTGTVAGTASLLGIILAAVGAAGVAFRRRKNND